jgi:hypothetical protein
MFRAVRYFFLLSFVALSGPALAENPQWPNGPNDDPLESLPDDPGFIKFNAKGQVTGGQWNLWSFVPPSWADNKGFRSEEIAMGTGIHADRAWQRTIGSPQVIIAVLDSGIKWDENSLLSRHYLNKGELANCKPQQTDPAADDEWDIDGNGRFNIFDYSVANPDTATELDASGNQNGKLDPGDLIRSCSDGVDDDKNGFVDDISGWDTMWNDNNPYDDTRYGHGTGEARDSGAAGNDGVGDIGVCPNCSILNVRVGDSFVVDVNDFATGVIFAVDSGASVIQEALGSVNNTSYAKAAIGYAYLNNVAIIASAGDELSFHHNVPGTNNHTIYVHAIVHDQGDAKNSTTFLNFNNCTNYGGQLLLSTPGGGCSSEATGITSGHAGLIYSAAVKADLALPLSSEEVRQILIQSVDDINIPEAAADDTKFPSGPGWDLHFGYGRNNARRSVDMILDDQIPPEADIVRPFWFEPIDVNARPTLEVTGRAGNRVDGKSARYDNYAWKLEYALGVDPKGNWVQVATGDSGKGGEEAELLGTLDLAKISEQIDYSKPITDSHQYSVTVRLSVTTSHNGETLKGEFRKTIHLLKDDSLLPGFPLDMGTSMESSPKIVDMNGDGAEEIVVASSDGYIHAIQQDGTEVEGWPVALNLRKELDTAGPNIRGCCAFRDDKTGCSTQGTVDLELARHTVMGSVAIGALTGDPTDLSIVSLSWDGFAYVFDQNGQLREGWPQRTNPEHSAVTSKEATLDEGFFAAPVLYDLDNDGDLEIIAAAMDQYLYIWHHDGSPLEGWPVLIKDPIETRRARIICTPAVGDADGDGFPEIALGTNEVFGSSGAENEARGYLLKHTGSPNKEDLLPALEEGWPVTTFGLQVNTLPVVGRGTPTNPAMADLDGDGTLEINLDAIAWTPNLWNHDGTKYDLIINNFEFGDFSDSQDAPTYTIINNGTFARLNPKGGIAIIKGTAGFKFALTFVQGGQRAVFDHQLSAWDTTTGYYLAGFPRVVADWQFFMNPTVVDLDDDGLPEVLNGTGGYLLDAFNYKGKQPAGFPKNLGGWIISSPGFGDLDGDGMLEVVSMTRAGWLFAWQTEGTADASKIEWQSFGHDSHNTHNYNHPLAQYNNYSTAPVPEKEEDSGGGCSAGAGPQSPTGLGFLGLCLALLFVSRRYAQIRICAMRARAPAL